MRHEFHPDALAEYEAAALYYAERDPRVGQRFVAAVDDAIDRILESPTRWRVLEGSCMTLAVEPVCVQCVTFSNPTVSDDYIDVAMSAVQSNTYKASGCQEDAAVASRGRGGSRGQQTRRPN